MRAEWKFWGQMWVLMVLIGVVVTCVILLLGH